MNKKGRKNRIKETNKELAQSEPTDREKKSIKSISEAVLSRMINEAKTMDELDRVSETIAKVQISPQIKERLRTHYIQRRHELSVFGTQKAEIEKDEEDIRSNYTRDRYRDIVRYSFEHSAEETANRFNIPEYSVQSLRKDFRREFRDEYIERIAIYSFCYGRQETMVEFKIGRNSVDTYRREFRIRFPERYAELVEEIKSSVRWTDERKKLSEDQKNDMKEPSAEVEVVDVQKDEPVTETATLRIEELKKENASLKDKLLALLLKQVGLVQILVFSFLHYR